MAKPITVIGIGMGAALGTLLGGYIASKMTTTPANKRVLYSGVIQIAAGFLLRKRWPGLALGMVGSGVVNVISVGLMAAPNSLLDGSRFADAALPLPEANTMLDAPQGATFTPPQY